MPGHDAAGQHLAPDPVAEVAGEVGHLVDAGGEDHRGGQQEGELGRVLVVEAADQAGDHGDAGPADPGEQGQRLARADDPGLPVLKGVEAAAVPVGVEALLDGQGPDLGAPPDPFAGQQDQPVDGEEDGGGQRLGEEVLQRVLQGQAEDAGPGRWRTTISQARRSSAVSTLRLAMLLTKPEMIRAQSLQKKISRARALAQCRPTTKAR